MGCHPKPIDELHHFSRWLLHHQPDDKWLFMDCYNNQIYIPYMEHLDALFRLGEAPGEA
jgi:hypothetical protein